MTLHLAGRQATDGSGRVGVFCGGPRFVPGPHDRPSGNPDLRRTGAVAVLRVRSA
jgi:hypothetical protein